MTRKNYIFASLLSMCSATSALAENSVVIDQVGGGSVVVKQSGEGNSVKITQKKSDLISEDEKETGKNDKIIKNSEAQKNNAPYLSIGERARINSVIKQEIPPQNPKTTNKIDVQQTGKNNKTSVSQSGDDNDFLLKQEGANNSYKKSQKGKHNRSKIIQNDKLIEEEETDN